jgi:hypothetical protein
MPLRPDNERRYPRNRHTEIRLRILGHAGHPCVDSPDDPDRRAASDEPHPVAGSSEALTIGHLSDEDEAVSDNSSHAWCRTHRSS